MKIQSFALILFMVAAFHAKADETNVYVTYVDSEPVYVDHQFLNAQQEVLIKKALAISKGSSLTNMPSPAEMQAAYERMLRSEAQKVPECRPAADFPDGNWGAITNGVQLSLRFAKTSYTNGEPITAVLLLRNVTHQIPEKVSYLRRLTWLDGPAKFKILSSNGGRLSGHERIPGVMGGGSVSKLPVLNTQRRYEEHLNGGYDFIGGEYAIQAYIEFWSFEVIGGKPVRQGFEAKSAPVKIEIKD